MKAMTRSAACALSMCALTLATQAPAAAATYSHVDAKHDVEKFPQQVQSPLYRKADITRVRISHGDKAVRFTLRLRSASLTGVKFRALGFTVKTPAHTFSGAWDAFRGADQYFLSDETGTDVSCAESSGRNGRTVWLRLDRACFGAPRWVRASVHVGTNDGTSAWEDNALSNEWRRSSDDVFSPRVRAS